MVFARRSGWLVTLTLRGRNKKEELHEQQDVKLLALRFYQVRFSTTNET